MIDKLIFYSERDKEFHYSPEIIGMIAFKPILDDKDTYKHLGFIYSSHYPLAAGSGLPIAERRKRCKELYYGDEEIPEFVLEAEKVYLEFIDSPELKAINDVFKSLEKSRTQIELTNRTIEDDKGKWVYDTSYMEKQEAALLNMVERCARVKRDYHESLTRKNKIHGGQSIGAHTDGKKAAEIKSKRK